MSENCQGYYGRFGGRYVPETLMAALDELEAAYRRYAVDPEFIKELNDLYQYYSGRPTPLYYAERFSRELGQGRIYLKREDLNIPAPIRSTTPSVRFCWPSGWAKSGSSPRPAPGSTAWPPRRSPPGSG